MQPTLVNVVLAMPEILSPVWMEMCMFGLAMACYAMFTGAAPSAAQSGWLAKGAKVGRRAAPASKPGGNQGMSVGTQKLWTALRQGRCVAALDQFQQLPEASASQCSARILSALARAPLGDEVTEKLLDIAGRFSGSALEVAAEELQRHGELHACRQLYQIAGLASIPKTQRALELIVRGHSADQGLMHALVEEIVAEGGDSAKNLKRSLLATSDAKESVREVKGKAERSRICRELQRHAEAICTFGKEGHLDKAVGIFEGLRQGGAPVNALVYNCLLDACIHCEDMPTALKYFAEARGAGLADVVSFNTVMKGHIARGEFNAAQDLFQEMSTMGLSATLVTYHLLLNSYVQQGDRRGMWKVIERMQDAGYGANSVTCSILLKAVLTPAHTTDLLRIVKIADGVDRASDEVLFASLVEACTRAKNLAVLSERMQVFAAQGASCQLTSPTYGTMIKAFGRAGDVARVRELWKQMVTQQVTPSEVTVGCMVEALVVNNCSQEAWELAQALWEDESQRASVNTVIYSTILKGFAMAKQHEKVTTLYQEMKQRGITRNLITYNTILNSIARCGLMDRVPELLEDMRTSEPRVDPDLVTYSTIIKGYCQSGNVDKGLELLRQMCSEECLKPDEVMYNSLLDGCAREHRLEDALRLQAEMREAKIVPSNYTLSILCKLLGRARRLTQAFEMVESISRVHGFQPNIQVYTCLIQACFHNRQVGKALALHDKIVREGIVPDEYTYTVLASGCLQAGMADKAATVVRCAYHLPCDLQLTPEPQGVESKCLKEVLGQLRRASPAAAQALDAELQSCPQPRGGSRARKGAPQRASGRRPAK